MPTHKILADLDVVGEVQGTSLDINGNGDISGTLLTSGNVRLAADVQVGDTTAQNSYGALQVNQTSDVDEEGIAVLNSGGGRSIRLYCDGSDNAVINSGNGGNQTLKLNEGSGNVIVGGDITCGDDLFMPSAGVINFNSGDVTITHSSNTLTISGGVIVLDASDHVLKDGANILDENDNTILSTSGGNIGTDGNLTVGGKVTTTEIEGTSILLDSAADIELNADGADIILKDATVGFGRLKNDSSDFVIKSDISDKDMIFKGNDGGSTITALTLDMSAAGKATFNNDVVAFSDRKLKDNIETLDGKKVLDMRGVSFTRKDTGLPSSGVIAQEIQEVAPELVNETNGTLGVSYGNLVGYLIEAIKDQQKQIDELKEICNGCSK